MKMLKTQAATHSNTYIEGTGVEDFTLRGNVGHIPGDSAIHFLSPWRRISTLSSPPRADDTIFRHLKGKGNA